LALLHGEKPSQLDIDMMNVSLILYAEHEFNASTFAARVTAATLSDFYSAITSAIGTLRGPLHGGANEAAMELIEQFKDPDDAETQLLKMLADKAKIMGFGHRVYKDCDPRSDIIKVWSKKVGEAKHDLKLYEISERVEAVMRREKKLFPNLDFYSASAYHYIGIATPLFTPIFVMSRITGWSAHVFEQRANNRLIRPTSEYIGPEPRAFVEIGDR
jgi:2-methylcitrate synthase